MTVPHSGVLGAVIVAAGSGQRFGNPAKVFQLLDGLPVLQHSVQTFLSLPDIRAIVVVLGPHTIEEGSRLLRGMDRECIRVCPGGDSRSGSVRAGLDALPEEVDLVAVHDAGRPLARLEMVQRVIDAALDHGAAVPSVPPSDTIVRIRPDRTIESVEPRDSLGAVQTPQVARRDWLESAYRSETNSTDESGALLAAGYPVMTVDGSVDNIKLTWPGDLEIAETIQTRVRL